MNSSSSNLLFARSSRKALISPSFDYSKYSEERPKGKTRGLFFTNSTSINTERKKSYKKLFLCKTSRDPILQNSPLKPINKGKKVLPSAPSCLVKYENERKHKLPSELGIGNRYEQHYQSQIFKETSVSYLFNGKNKTLLSKTCEVSKLLKYDYALQYKDLKITPKVGEKLQKS